MVNIIRPLILGDRNRLRTGNARSQACLIAFPAQAEEPVDSLVARAKGASQAGNKVISFDLKPPGEYNEGSV